MKLKNLLLSLACVAALLTSCSHGPQPAIFNAATYNMRVYNNYDSIRGNAWEQREPYMASLIRFHDFDIFGTQEGVKHQLDTLKRDLPGYEYIGAGREDGKEAGEYAAIFYKTALFDVLDNGNFWLSETPDRPGKGWDAEYVRICSWGHFRHKSSGREFLFVNLHMDHVGVVARRESARLIKRKMAEFGDRLPVILTGDFNVDQNSEAYKEILVGGVLLDSYGNAGFRYANTGTYNSYDPALYTDSRIDHIFVTPDIEVMKYGVLTDTYRRPEADTASYKAPNAPREIDMKAYSARIPSDHFPVKVELKIGE